MGQLKEVYHAANLERASPPPRRTSRDTPLPPMGLWQTVPAAARLKTLQTLSRVVAQNLLPSPAKEVGYERA